MCKRFWRNLYENLEFTTKQEGQEYKLESEEEEEGVKVNK